MAVQKETATKVEAPPQDPRQEQDDEKMSVSSRTSRTSKTSFFSIGSKASKVSSFSSSAANMFRKGLTFGRRDSTDTMAQLVDVQVGDVCETIAVVTVRQGESLDTEMLCDLPVGTQLAVLEVGEGRRIKVSAGRENDRTVGWVSSKTKINEPLVVKCSEQAQVAFLDFEVGGEHEVKTLVTVRTGEDLDSDFVCELKSGTMVKILELGVHNQRRVKVGCEAMTGWISTTTKCGESLIGKVEDPNSRLSGYGTSTGSKVKLLLESARAGNLEQVRKLVDARESVIGRFSSRPHINSSDVRGKTALIYAAAFGCKDVVEFLLTKRELDLNAVDDTQKSALHHASKRARRPSDSTTDALLADTVQKDIIELLLRAKAYLEARDHNGCTALMFAVANGDVVSTRTLVNAQANVNVKDFEGHRPLDYAINFGHSEIVSILKVEGALAHTFAADEAAEKQRQSVAGGGKAVEEASEALDAASLAVSTAASTSLGDENPQDTPESQEAAPSPSSASATASSSPTKKRTVKKKTVLSDGTSLAGEEQKKPKAKKKVDKGEGGEKAEKRTKKKAAKAAPSDAMMEALACDNAFAEVAVEEAPKEDVDLKVRALAKLKQVMQSEGSPGELEAAIKAAKAEGANDEELAEAQKALKALKSKFRTIEKLLAAAASRDVAALEASIRKGEEQNAAGPPLEALARALADARAVLAEEGPKQKALEDLQAAVNTGETKRLKDAIKKAKKVGLPREALQEYENMIAQAESKEQVQAALQRAVRDRDVGALKLAIQQAKDIGLPAEVTADAEATLADEEPKVAARQMLEEACEKCTKAALSKAISVAKEAKLHESEYSEASELLRNEEEKERLLEAMKQCLQETKSVDMSSIDAVKAAKERLTEAIRAAARQGVAEADLFDAELRRKKLHNTVEDLKGSIRVFCRVRPFSSKEADTGDTQVTQQTDLMSLDIQGQQFRFDAVFSPGTQDEIFEDCRDLVQSAVDGYNVTLFAYGQTGAGKTFTMAGVPGQLGISPRTIKEVYEVTRRGEDRCEYTVMGSMLELYRSDLVDLLVKGNPATSSKSKLNIRTDKTGMVSVEPLTEEECNSVEDLEALVERGTKARAVAATAMNSESSRSHLVLMIKIISVNKETKEQQRGKILIVDLAGSERLKKSQTREDQQKESIEINKSLTALGDVIEALTKGRPAIPYRNHKLTQLMQDSLGGTAKTLMFVNCSPASSNADETINSLKYAQRAKNITNAVQKSA